MSLDTNANTDISTNPSANTGTDTNFLAKLRSPRGWTAGLGIFTLILGFAAIALPFITTLAIEILIAWLFIGGGVTQLIHAIQSRSNSKGFIFKLLLGLFYLSGGLLLLFYPLAGVLGLTLALGSFILLEGALQLALAIQLRPERGWVWSLTGGIVGILFGSLIVIEWPSDAPWILGLLVGLNLISDGLPLIVLAVIGPDNLSPSEK